MTTSHIIGAASNSVWKVISQSAQLTRYHPFCQDTTVIKWPGVGAKDTVMDQRAHAPAGPESSPHTRCHPRPCVEDPYLYAEIGPGAPYLSIKNDVQL